MTPYRSGLTGPAGPGAVSPRAGMPAEDPGSGAAVCAWAAAAIRRETRTTVFTGRPTEFAIARLRSPGPWMRWRLLASVAGLSPDGKSARCPHRLGRSIPGRLLRAAATQVAQRGSERG